MKQFILVSLFFMLFSAVVGGALFLSMRTVQLLHLSEDYEHALMALCALVALVAGGLLMKQLHATIERRI